MIEQFLLALSKIKALKRGELWQETAASVNEELQRLAGKNAEAIARLSETEILALLMKGEPTQVIHTKMLMMVALLKDAGDAAVAQHRVEESREFYLKGLHLLMNALESSEAAEIPEFVPKLEELRGALESDRLPLATQARLMRHFEAIGDFAKAEDALFAMISTAIDGVKPDVLLIHTGAAYHRSPQGHVQWPAFMAAGSCSRIFGPRASRKTCSLSTS